MNDLMSRYRNDDSFHNLVRSIVRFVVEYKMTIVDFQEAIWFIQEKDMIRQTRIEENTNEQYQS
jgi:hypothetical protein